MDRLVALAVVGLVALIGWLPVGWARSIGRCVGWLSWVSRGDARRVTEINLARCLPGVSEAERQALARRSLAHTGQLALESGLLWRWPERRWSKLVQSCEGMELLEQAQRDGRPVLILVPHFGNWEFFALFLGRFGFTCLYDPPKIQALERPMVQARERTGGTLLPIGRRGVRQLMKTLEEGGISILLPDQVPERGSGGVQADFFGRPALTMTLVQKLSARYGPLVLTAAIRRVPGGFEVTLSEVTDPVDNPDEVVAATALNAAVEKVARRDLAQYQWEYKRFKRAADGSPY